MGIHDYGIKLSSIYTKRQYIYRRVSFFNIHKFYPSIYYSNIAWHIRRIEIAKMNNIIINKLRPSQLINFSYYLLCLLLAPFIVGIVMFVVRYVVTRCNTFTLTEQRIILDSGVFSKINDEIELFRVKDVKLLRPFKLRIFGLSNIVITSSDHNVPEYTLKGVRNGKEVMSVIRDNYLSQREHHKVRELDGL